MDKVIPVKQSTYLFFFLLFLITSCTNNTTKPTDEPVAPKKPEHFVPSIDYTLEKIRPHDSTSFTEGLFFYNNELYESSGAPEDFAYTKSVFGIVNQKTGKLTVKAELDKKVYFGEGTIGLKNKIYQLTYKNQICFVYDAKTYKQIGQFKYQNQEGWGLTTDGTSIIMSDGTSNLTYLNPDNFNVVKTLAVNNNGYPEVNLNELEYIKGYIYANIWTKNYIVKINPKDGNIEGIIDLTALSIKAKEKYHTSEVMNGIAYNEADDKIYVTGKLWPNMYQINFVH